MMIAPAVSACGSDDMDDGSVTALGGEIQGARGEVARHHDAVTAATALDDVPAEVERHGDQMSAIMGRMDIRMANGMSHCSGPGMGRMHEMMGPMGSEMQAHREAMIEAATLGEARAQCASHTVAMNGMLDAMRTALGDAGCMMR